MDVLLCGNELISNCFSKSLITVSEFDEFNGWVNVGGIIGLCERCDSCTLSNDFAVSSVIREMKRNVGCFGGICGFGHPGAKVSDCHVGDFEIDSPTDATGGICGAVKKVEGFEEFSCTNCSYYSLKVSQFCRDECKYTNIKRVENKNDLPRIIDVVGNEFKELPSGSVALKWQ